MRHIFLNASFRTLASRWAMPVLEILRRQVLLVCYCLHLSRSKLNAIRFSGTIPGTDIPLNVLFIGSYNTIRDTFFAGCAEAQVLGTVHPLKQNSAKAKLIEPDTDVVITTRLPWSRNRPPGDFVMPAHLDCMLTLPDTADEFMNQLRSDHRRKIRQALKAGLQFERGQTYEDYKHFYDAMLAPLMRYRHGEKAVLVPFEEFYSTASRASLLFVTLKGSRVGGVHIRWPVLSRFRYFACYDEIGMPDDISQNPVLFRQINMAIYYIMCLECIARGVKHLCLGDGLSKVNSGLLRFKGSWGADYLPNKDFHRYYVDFLSDKKHSLLAACHLIRVENEQLIPLVGVDESGAILNAEENKAFQGTYRKFQRFEYVYPDGETQLATTFGSQKAPSPEKRPDRSHPIPVYSSGRASGSAGIFAQRARFFSWLSILAIATLSLVPGGALPQTGVPIQAENFLAYFLTAILLGVHQRDPADRSAPAIALCTFAAISQILQTWVPGRVADFMGFAISSKRRPERNNFLGGG